MYIKGGQTAVFVVDELIRLVSYRKTQNIFFTNLKKKKKNIQIFKHKYVFENINEINIEF